MCCLFLPITTQSAYDLCVCVYDSIFDDTELEINRVISVHCFITFLCRCGFPCKISDYSVNM